MYIHFMHILPILQRILCLFFFFFFFGGGGGGGGLFDCGYIFNNLSCAYDMSLN